MISITLFMYSLTVIVPFYNEELYLKNSIQRLINSKVADFIFLVNDSSLDYSSEIAQDIEKINNNIRYFSTPFNLGKGGAINYVKQYIESSHVAIHDADLEYNPDDLIKLKKLSMENIDSLILGSRFIDNIFRLNRYKSSYFANKILSLFFSLINRYKVTDIATCYKLFPNSFFQNIKIYENGFAFEVEILSKFLKYKYSVLEIPITYVGRSFNEGKKINYKDGFRYLYTIIKYKFFR